MPLSGASAWYSAGSQSGSASSCANRGLIRSQASAGEDAAPISAWTPPTNARTTGVSRTNSGPTSDRDARDRVRDVGLLEPRDLVLAQRKLLRRQGVFEVLGLCGADDRRRDARLVQQPRERDLRGRNAAHGGDLGDAVDDGEVDLGRVEGVAERVGPRAGRQALALARACSRQR